MRELKNVIDWYLLGLKLGLSMEVLKKQEFDEGGSDMIHQWLKMEGATWERLATALAQAGEAENAKGVMKYCKVRILATINCTITSK